jgi:hypothetical protein
MTTSQNLALERAISNLNPAEVEHLLTIVQKIKSMPHKGNQSSREARSRAYLNLLEAIQRAAD